MDSNLQLNTDDVSSNLYPALLQVFTIILLGYFAGTLKIVNKEQGVGLNVFVGTFILPVVLLKVHFFIPYILICSKYGMNSFLFFS